MCLQNLRITILFFQNLFQGTYGFTNRMGRIPDFHDFDGAFFGLLQQMNEAIEPTGRLLMETAYEAIIDAGKLSIL